MSKVLACLLALVAMVFSQAAYAEEFDNAAVVALSGAGLADDVILSKIDSLPCGFDVSTNGIINLRVSGVSNTVIAAMVQRCVGAANAQGAGGNSSDPTSQRSPGIYLESGNDTVHNLVALRPINATGGQMTGNGSILFPFRARLSISGSESGQAVVNRQPTFYFYFENDDRRVGDFGSSATMAAQSPNEFSLVTLRVRDGQRQLSIGRGNMFNTHVGLDPEDVINVSIDQIGDGIYRVVPGQILEPGQFGFVLRMGGESYRIFDFSVN